MQIFSHIYVYIYIYIHKQPINMKTWLYTIAVMYRGWRVAAQNRDNASRLPFDSVPNGIRHGSEWYGIRLTVRLTCTYILACTDLLQRTGMASSECVSHYIGHMITFINTLQGKSSKQTHLLSTCPHIWRSIDV